MVEERERGDVVDAVVLRLRELGIDDPAVFPCVPEAVLRVVPGAATIPPFAHVEAQLVTLTAERREAAITATLLILLTELLKAVELAAVDNAARLTAAERELHALSLPDLPAFLEAWSQDAVSRGASAIDETWDGTSRAYFASGLSSRLHDAIQAGSVTTAAQMAGAAFEAVRYYLRDEADEAVSGVCHRADATLRESVRGLAVDFTDQYSRLARLADTDPVLPEALALPTGGVSIPDLDRVDRALNSIAAQLSSSGFLKMSGGAALGAAVGSLVTPVIGTAVGAFLGGLLSKPSPDQLRSQFSAQALPILENTRDEVAEAVAEAVRGVFADYAGRIDAVCRTYLRDWLESIDTLTQREEQSRSVMAQRIAAAADIARDARERQREIAALRVTNSRRTVGAGSRESKR